MKTTFIDEYKDIGNSILAYKKITNCDDKSLKNIADDSFKNLEDIFEEVDFYVATNTKRGMIKNTGKILNGFISLGGSYMLEVHNKHYADIYEAIYKPAFNEIKYIEQITNENLSSIGEQLNELNSTLNHVGKILKSKLKNKPIKNNSLNQYEKFNSGFHSSVNIGFGSLVGGTTALGAWSVVSLIGSASTGTAISSLSGIAASNATLAWFGGGSLASGGAGMAGGFWVLGGIVAAPIIFFTTKNSYKKVDEVKVQKDKLIEESNNIITLIPQAKLQLIKTEKHKIHVTNLLDEYIPQLENEIKNYKHHRSYFKDLLSGDMNSKQEVSFNKLNKLTGELLSKLGI